MVTRICLVDDEQEILANLKLEICEQQEQWEVLTYHSGLDAMKEVMKGKVSLVVTDIAMPDMDGYELYRRIRDYDPEIPVIMITGFGYDPNHVLVRSRQDGLQDILFKPFETDKLVALIQKRLKH